MTKTSYRLRAEAQFQAKRTLVAGDEPREKFYFLAARAVERYRAAFNDVYRKHVLVVGCAEGGVTPLARKGARVVGIDISAAPLTKLCAAIAKENLQTNATVLVMDAENTAFRSGSFDIICCSGVLHHLDVERACRSWIRILRPDGEVIMMEPMAWNPVVSLYRLFTPSSRTPDEHPLKPRDIRVLRKFFGQVDMTSYVLTSAVAAVWAYVPGLCPLKDRTLRILEPLDDLLLSSVPFLRYCAWTSVIR